MPFVLVDLYGKPGCHLCEDVLAELKSIQREIPFHLTEHNILNDPELELKYGFDIPAVVVNGRQFSTHTLNSTGFKNLIRKEKSFNENTS